MVFEGSRNVIFQVRKLHPKNFHSSLFDKGIFHPQTGQIFITYAKPFSKWIFLQMPCSKLPPFQMVTRGLLLHLGFVYLNTMYCKWENYPLKNSNQNSQWRIFHPCSLHMGNNWFFKIPWSELAHFQKVTRGVTVAHRVCLSQLQL